MMNINIDEQKQGLKEQFDLVKNILTKQKSTRKDVLKAIKDIEVDVNDIFDFIEIEIQKTDRIFNR